MVLNFRAPAKVKFRKVMNLHTQRENHKCSAHSWTYIHTLVRQMLSNVYDGLIKIKLNVIKSVTFECQILKKNLKLKCVFLTVRSWQNSVNILKFKAKKKEGIKCSNDYNKLTY